MKIVIPTIPFGKIADFRNGLNFSSSAKEGDLKIIGVGDFQNRITITLENLETIKYPEKLDPNYLLVDGDLLFVRSNGNRELIGRCLIVNNVKEPVSHSGFTIRARLQPNTIRPELIAEYFACGLARRLIQGQGRGTNISNLNQEILSKLPIPNVSKPEEEKILSLCSFYNIIISQYQSLLKAKRSLKQGLMQQLLTGKRRFPEFENKQWKVVKVGEVTEINPSLKCNINKIEQVTFLSMSDLEEGGGILRRQSRCYQEVSKGYTSFRENDVLVAKITPCFENGKSALATELANKIGFGSTEFHVLRCSKEIQPKFLYQIIRTQSFRSQGTSHMTGSAGQKRVPYKFIKNYKISLPSIPEQNRICQILETVDSEIMFLQQLQGLLKLQKRGLMQKLLTGEIQVPISDENAA